MLTPTLAAGLIRPESIGPLIVAPLMATSTAFQVSTLVDTQSASLRFPVITEDPHGSWLGPGADIDPSDPDVDFTIVTPQAYKSMTKVPVETANDTSPAAAQVVADGLVRDIARQVDIAFFGNAAALTPSGLLSLPSVQHVAAGSAFKDLDAFEEAASKLENVGSTVTAWCASANTCLTLSRLRQFTGTGSTSNVPLLSSDPTQPTRRQILGAGLWPLPAGVIADNVIWALDRSKSFVVLRSNTELAVDPSFFFGSHSLAVRAVVRVAYGWPHEQAVVKIVAGGGS